MPEHIPAQEEVLFAVIAPHIAVLTLNRPASRNAISTNVARLVEQYVERIEQDEAIWVAILTTSSDKAFCAGADLAEIAAGQGGFNTARGGFAGFIDFPRVKPWIAAVRGTAVGGGCELCLACDLIVASDAATFGLPEVKRSLLAGGGGVYRLARALPRNIAFEMIATGESIPAAAGYAMGLVNRMAPDAEVLSAAVALAEQITRNAPIAVRESLRVARLCADLPDTQLREMSLQAYDRIGSTSDFQEGPRAFLEKRLPRWTGR